MPHHNIIEVQSEEELWKRVGEQLDEKKDELDYSAQFAEGEYLVTLDIDFHPESGSEDGEPVTSFTAQLKDDLEFRFRIDKQDLKSEIRKLFGMQDVVIGQAEFDRSFIIQGSDEEKVKELLGHPEVYSSIMENAVSTFEIKDLRIGANKQVILTLEAEERIKEAERLRGLYQPFKRVLGYL